MLLALPCVAHAAGMGKLTILSALGRPLLAEVELISVQDGEFATLKARIAPPEAFTKANVQYSPALIGVRLSIERRADGQPYIKIISTRPVNEPFIDLLVELSWAHGLLVREYTALIDPPGYTPGAPFVQAVPLVEIAPAATPETQALAPAPPVEAKPAPKAPADARPAAAPARTYEPQALAPTAPVEARPAAKKPAVTRPATAPASSAGSKEYGPVERGETLSKIAARIKPDGVTLEQMLVSLYHANRDAFGSNMDVLYVGSVLRIPEELQVAATAQSEAMREVRARAAGKETPMEVLRLSKSELPVAGKARGGERESREVTERLRALETELDALEKALTEANKLVAQLEQTVKTMRQRIAVTEQTSGVSAAGASPQPVSGAKPGVAQPEPARAEPAKMEPAKDAGQMTAAAPGSGEKAALATQPAAAGSPQGEAPKAEAPKVAVAAPPPPKPKPTEIAPAQPDMIDQILAEPLYPAGGGLLALLGAYWFVRRRRTRVPTVVQLAVAVEPRVATAAPQVATVTPQVATPAPQVANVEPQAANVDPLVEANLFLSYGRDERAEEILIDVLEENPANQEAALKLLQIYAKRKDPAEFEKIAHALHTQTTGAGDNWLKAAALGSAFDPGNPLYGAVQSAPAAATPAASGAATAVGKDVKSPPPAPAAAATDSAKPDAGAVNSSQVAQDTARDTGTAHAAAAAAPAVADLGIALNFPGAAQPSATPDKTPAVSASETSKTDAADVPAVAFPEITLNFPGATQPSAAPEKTPAAPKAEATKTVVPNEPLAPMIGTIDFESTTSAPAAPGNGKDNTPKDKKKPASRKP